MKKIFIYTTMILVLLTVCISCVGCVKEVKIEIEKDVNEFDDIYELENGKYLVVEDNAIGILESLDVKGKETIENFVPETRPLNPHVIGEYIYISQDISTDKEYKTKVTKIKADSLHIAEEKEFGFGFDCMTSNGESLVYLGCRDNAGETGSYLIDDSLNDEYISGNVWTYEKSSGLRRFDKIVYAQFSGNKGIVFAQPEEGYGYLITVVIEGNELKSCCSFCIVECNAQILSTDYDTKLSFLYNYYGTDPMALLGGAVNCIEVEQDDLFTPRDFSENTENGIYEECEIKVKKEEVASPLGYGVGEYLYKEDGYGIYVESGKWIYYFRTANTSVGVWKYKRETWNSQKQKRLATFSSVMREEIDYETTRYTVSLFGEDKLYFHISDKDGYIASGFIDLSGSWWLM